MAPLQENDRECFAFIWAQNNWEVNGVPDFSIFAALAALCQTRWDIVTAAPLWVQHSSKQLVTALPAAQTPQELGTLPWTGDRCWGNQSSLSSPHWHCHPNECEPTHLWACASQVLRVFDFASPHQELQLSSNITRCNFCPAWPRHVLSFNMFWAGNEGTFAYYQLLKFLFSFPPNKYFSRPNTKSYTVHSLWNVHFIFKELASRRATYLPVFWSSKRKEKR